MKLNLKSIDLNLLTVFDAIMETRKLSKAGDQLGMSQPAMSAALFRLRQTMKDDLFIRSHEGMIPTPRAKIIHQSVSRALELIREELRSGREFQPEFCERHFRVLGGDYMEILFYGLLLSTINPKAPQLTSEIRPLDASAFNQALKRGEIDIALHYTHLEDDGLNHELVLEDKLVVVARKGHPRIRKKVTKNLFMQEKHVTLLLSKDNLSHLDIFMKNRKIERKVGARVTQFSSMIPVVLNTDYLGVMPERLARWFSSYHKISYYSIPFAMPILEIQLIWANRFNSDLAHAWFRSQLKAVMLDD